MHPLFAHLLTPHAITLPIVDARAWWEIHLDVSTHFDDPCDRAIAAGARSDRVGWAFASGYECALQRLVPSLGTTTCAVLCATESGGAHPRAIATVLDRVTHTLDGHKRWSTLGTVADTLLVVASEGMDTLGRNRLCVVRVRADAPGVTLVPMAPTPFVPEISHAEVHLANVSASDDDVLPGDGYARYLKPFRTIEDVHVTGAVLGYVTGTAVRDGWSREAVEELLALVAMVRGVATADPQDAHAHVALAGVLRSVRAWLDANEAQWSKSAEDARERWQRDRVLLAVADKAREARREAAWARVEAGRER